MDYQKVNKDYFDTQKPVQTFGATGLLYNKKNLTKIIKLIMHLFHGDAWNQLIPQQQFKFIKKIQNQVLEEASYKPINRLLDSSPTKQDLINILI